MDFYTKTAEILTSQDFSMEEYEISPEEFQEFVSNARYPEFKDYNLGNLSSKHLDHFIATKFLEISSTDVYMDVASSRSPVPEIYERMFGIPVFRQDLTYEDGLHGNRIGSDAAKIPLADHSISKIGLHSSFEHFEGDSDIGFIREAERILKPGGRACIVPLFLAPQYTFKIDPSLWSGESIDFENDARIEKRDNWGIRFARFYDIDHLEKRIRRNLGDLQLKICVGLNLSEINKSCRDRYFTAILEKPK